MAQPAQSCLLSSTVILYCSLSQEHLKARLCHCPHPCYELTPPLLSNSILHSDTPAFGQDIKSQSNWYSWSPLFLQANNAASPCFVSGTEQQGRWLKPLNNFTATFGLLLAVVDQLLATIVLSAQHLPWSNALGHASSLSNIYQGHHRSAST